MRSLVAMATTNAPTQKISDVISTFRPTRRFRAEDPKQFITSLDFDDSGELAIICRSDDILQLYNCKEGKHAKDLVSQKYGAHLARFTHHSSSILYASTKHDDNIRYLSTHDNSYIRYFKGHQDRVTSIALSPSDDSFLSSSLDNTVKLWSVRSSSPTGTLKIHQPLLTAYDPSATVIAIASASAQTILLYDIRNFDKPPFSTFDLLPLETRFVGLGGQGIREWTKLEFSNDGKNILLATAGGGHYILDAFEGTLRHFCLRRAHSGRLPPSQIPSVAGGPQHGVSGQGDACISPDGRFLVGGSADEGMLVWDIYSDPSPDNLLKPKSELPGVGKAAVVEFNPKYNMMVSADRDLLFWLPDPELG